MNNSLIRTLKFAALTALAGTALMQAEQATFHLPVAAHWGDAMLQPGDYKMVLPDAGIGHLEFRIEGEGKTMFAFPRSVDFSKTANSSHLELREVDGEYFILGFSSGSAGKDFTFYAPKRARLLEAAKGSNNLTVAATN